MPNKFVPINPGTPLDHVVAAVNNNFAKIDGEAVVKIFKGLNGTNAITFGRYQDDKYGLLINDGTTNRILIGIAPDGTVGMWVSKVGEEVLDAI